MKTAYIKHPVSMDDFNKAASEGYRVLDLKFKPETLNEGDIVIGEEKPKRTRKKKD